MPNFATKLKQKLMESFFQTKKSLIGRRIFIQDLDLKTIPKAEMFRLREILFKNPADNFLQKHFKRQTFFTVQHVFGFGSVYLNIDILRAKTPQVAVENRWMVRMKMQPHSSRTKAFLFAMNFYDIYTSSYRILPTQLFEENYVQLMNKELPVDQKNNTLTVKDILQYIKDDFLSNLFYLDTGNYKTFFVTDNSPKSPFFLKNDFDKFLYRIKEQALGFNIQCQNEFVVKARTTKRIGD